MQINFGKKIEKEDGLEDLKDFNLIVPAKDLLDAIVKSTDATNGDKPMNDVQARNMKLVLGFLNSYIRAYHTKITYFRLTGVANKIAAIKRINGKK